MAGDAGEILGDCAELLGRVRAGETCLMTSERRMRPPAPAVPTVERTYEAGRGHAQRKGQAQSARVKAQAQAQAEREASAPLQTSVIGSWVRVRARLTLSHTLPGLRLG